MHDNEEAVEILANHNYAYQSGSHYQEGMWGMLDEVIRDAYRGEARSGLEALAPIFHKLEVTTLDYAARRIREMASITSDMPNSHGAFMYNAGMAHATTLVESLIKEELTADLPPKGEVND